MICSSEIGFYASSVSRTTDSQFKCGTKRVSGQSKCLIGLVFVEESRNMDPLCSMVGVALLAEHHPLVVDTDAGLMVHFIEKVAASASGLESVKKFRHSHLSIFGPLLNAKCVTC